MRGQSMVEFALVLPILVLLIFGILDLGRVLVAYIEISQAVGEAARMAAIAPTSVPSNSDVLGAVTTQYNFVQLAAPCPNAAVPTNPTSTQLPGVGQAWLYIDEPTGANANADNANAPAGQGTTASCPAIPARSVSHDQLQITIVYNFQPFTPLIAQIVGSQIVLTSTSVVQVEY